MIPFDNIPNNLRSSLFFSEISVNGSVPTVQSNNDPAPPLISCDGATNSMSFSQIAGVWSIYVDDFETPVATGNIGPALSQVLTAYSGKLIGDYDGVMYIQSTDTSNHRIKLEPISGTSFTANTEDNPTFLEYEDGSLTFCLSAMPKRYFEGIGIDPNGPDVNFSVSGSDIGSIKVTDPNGLESIFTPEPLEAVHLGYIEGFYTISSVNGFDNLIGDVYFKSSLNQSIVSIPTIDSVTRAPTNIVTILGTAKPFSVVTLIPDDNDDEPIAYSRVLEGESNFSFILELPVAFSGYVRCRDGNIGSEGATLNI
ncbi:hypothetical protein F900_01859 [Acinetobacter modestus]|uniref:Uncharacterized protein n=1 Tax=Acinetobacter modestus TaxID=1776740 RepID=N9NFT6_9GAMM|nr:hypothetical protein [Acinetobacter modestus]ENX00875.1 hypothetical protein F900_01859 [Acinetobacter modestus]